MSMVAGRRDCRKAQSARGRRILIPRPKKKAGLVGEDEPGA
jgi:hypothetical protein